MYEVDLNPSPFWGEDRNIKGGRDPLAVQNSSVIIYSDMVSGITNLTLHIRYNAFYCWLLTLIAKNVGNENIDSHKLQFRYLRRGELLYAYMMHFNYPDVTGSAGSTYAYNYDKGEVLNLAEGADIENKNSERGTYWKNPLGIFGQYYMGAMMQLRLVCPPDSTHATYRPTPDGVKLQDIYSRAIDSQCENLFWNAINTGEIRADMMPLLKSMALNNINGEEELNEYKQILLSPDNIGGDKVFNRYNTIKLLLNYISSHESSTRNFVLSFLKDNLLNAVKQDCKVSREEISWMLYEMNELSHSAYEAFHFSILYKLTDDNPLSVESLFGELKEEYDAYASAFNSDEWDIYRLYENQVALYKEDAYGALLCESLQLMIAIKEICDKYRDILTDVAQKGGYQRHPGFVIELICRLIGDQQYDNDWATVERILYAAINDHLSSSYAKSDIGQGLVHNYMLDEGVLWPLRKPVPVRTSPRLQNVIQYIRDIDLVRKEGERYVVTESGYKFLES